MMCIIHYYYYDQIASEFQFLENCKLKYLGSLWTERSLITKTSLSPGNNLFSVPFFPRSGHIFICYYLLECLVIMGILPLGMESHMQNYIIMQTM